MQIGIDLGATKIEYVLLDNNNKELLRNRIETPKNYSETITAIISIIKDIENKNKNNLNVGICHPGATDKTTGLIKNAHNSLWINDKNLIKVDLPAPLSPNKHIISPFRNFMVTSFSAMTFPKNLLILLN